MVVYRIDNINVTQTGPNVGTGNIQITSVLDGTNYSFIAGTSTQLLLSNTGVPTFIPIPPPFDGPASDFLQTVTFFEPFVENDLIPFLASSLVVFDGDDIVGENTAFINSSGPSLDPLVLFDGDCIFNNSNESINLFGSTVTIFNQLIMGTFTTFSEVQPFLTLVPPGESRGLRIDYLRTFSELIEFANTATRIDTSDIYTDQSWVTDPACCVLGESIVITETGEKLMRDIKTGDKVRDIFGKYINVSYNIVFDPSREFVKIDKNSLGKNVPNRDIFVRIGHPVYVRGKEIPVEKLVNDRTITLHQLDEAQYVYSICSKDRTFVLMNNLPVCTWSERDWNDQIANNYYGKNVKWTKQ